MTYTLCGAGRPLELPQPLAYEIKAEEEAPAAAFNGRFPCERALEGTYRQLRVQGGGRVWFSGFIDSVAYSSGSSRQLHISARSRAGRMLDSEAVPCSYPAPDLGTLFAVHAAPYGFGYIAGDTRRFAEAFTVQKGMSEWEALAAFCARYLGTQLRESGTDGLLAEPVPEGPELRLGAGGRALLQACVTDRPQRLCASYWGRQDDGWHEMRADPDAAMRGVLRRMLCADPQAAMQRARRAAWQATLLCPGWVEATLGQAARYCAQGGVQERGVVSGLLYSLTAQGQTSRITLRRRDEEM